MSINQKKIIVRMSNYYIPYLYSKMEQATNKQEYNFFYDEYYEILGLLNDLGLRSWLSKEVQMRI